MSPEDRSRVKDLADRLLSGNRRALAKAITLVENTRSEQRALANELMTQILPHTGKAIRVGISGVPGVGKSTFIESLGLQLVADHKVAVLAVDPSSKISGGSILGDKVRMEKLAREPRAFIRPSPSSGSLGGVTRRTRETLLVCEAAGFDVVLVETVGVGQSEVTVSEMVDFFMVLLLPGGGDEIQGIKRGIIEMADGLVVNKADGTLSNTAENTAHHYESAIHYLRPKIPGWQTPVHRVSALEDKGIKETWEMVLAHRKFLETNQLLEPLRTKQADQWFQEALREGLLDRLRAEPGIRAHIEASRKAVTAKQRSPHQAADEVIDAFLGI